MAKNKGYNFTERPIKTVKELDEDQQPREKAEKYGINVLSIPSYGLLF